MYDNGDVESYVKKYDGELEKKYGIEAGTPKNWDSLTNHDECPKYAIFEEDGVFWRSYSINVGDSREELSSYDGVILPLSDYDDKEHIRKIAREKSMSNSEDKDSQEICFLNEGEDYTSFLKKHGVNSVEGDFIDKDSNVLGRHKGIINYTIGQRKGLGIALGKPAFVTDIDAENNTVTLGENEDLFNRQVICDNVFFTSTSSCRIPEFIMGKRLYGKIRYAAKPAECSVEEYKDGMIKVLFDEPQRAATGGQSLVLYMDDEVCGGGLITIERK